jgi:predicted TIM-barrel fold metal-dependent hydrolase
MDFFDCNCEIGYPAVAPLKPAPTAADLLRAMQHVGIQRALVRHTSQIYNTPVEGNPYLLEALRSHDNLIPAWGILPPQTRELGTVEEFIKNMEQSGVRALWAFPDKHTYLLNAETFGELFETMISRRMPLFMNVNEGELGGFGGWALAASVLRQFPELRLVIVGHGAHGRDRMFRPLIEKYPNLHIDTSRYELDGGIAEFCGLYGSHRLLFGTNFPYTPMGGPWLTLLHSDIPDNDKQAIAGRNLERILREVRI